MFQRLRSQDSRHRKQAQSQLFTSLPIQQFRPTMLTTILRQDGARYSLTGSVSLLRRGKLMMLTSHRHRFMRQQTSSLRTEPSADVLQAALSRRVSSKISLKISNRATTSLSSGDTMMPPTQDLTVMYPAATLATTSCSTLTELIREVQHLYL